jgi:hypothetical protein
MFRIRLNQVKVSLTASMWVPLVKPFLSSGQLSLHP